MSFILLPYVLFSSLIFCFFFNFFQSVFRPNHLIRLCLFVSFCFSFLFISFLYHSYFLSFCFFFLQYFCFVSINYFIFLHLFVSVYSSLSRTFIYHSAFLFYYPFIYLSLSVNIFSSQSIILSLYLFASVYCFSLSRTFIDHCSFLFIILLRLFLQSIFLAPVSYFLVMFVCLVPS